jgi:hypothetical protein
VRAGDQISDGDAVEVQHVTHVMAECCEVLVAAGQNDLATWLAALLRAP